MHPVWQRRISTANKGNWTEIWLRIASAFVKHAVLHVALLLCQMYVKAVLLILHTADAEQ